MSNPENKVADENKIVTTPKIVPGRVKGAEFARNVHRVTPEASTKLEDVLNPAYWAHVAARFTPFDLIEIIPDGGAWYAQLIVTGCSKQHAKVTVLLFQKLHPKVPQQKEQDDAKFIVEFKGPQRKWSVIRVSDKEYVKEGMGSKEEATQWLADNEADLLGLA